MGEDKGLQRRKIRGIPVIMVMALDVALVNLAFYLSFTMRFLGNIPEFNVGPFLQMAPWLSLAAVILLHALDLYSKQFNGFMPILRAVLTVSAGLTLCSMVITFWLRGFAFPRTVFLIALLLQTALLLAWRVLHWRLEMWIHGQKKLLVIGHFEEVKQALEKLIGLPQGMFEIVQVLEPEEWEQISRWINRIDAVMIAGSLDMELKNRIIRYSFDGMKEVFIVPDLYEIILARSTFTQIEDTPLLECHLMQLSFPQAFAKRVLDLAVTALLLIITFPVLIILSAVVKLSSPGPVIYRQERVGLNGKIFTLYKFRTMVDRAEEESGPVFATEDDDRVTPVGRFLRASRLDELPQLFNVLKGDLSFVGPRPERPYFVDQFTREIAEYALRHLVKPGITGMAQVAGYYSSETKDKLRYDLYYISAYSLLLDLKIILSTIPALFNKSSAQGVKVGKGQDLIVKGKIE
ncbi:MAG: sugar transferase [Firmicutes bacterium]|nr:sugar transferase [Bacillota bacterium]